MRTTTRVKTTNKPNLYFVLARTTSKKEARIASSAEIKKAEACINRPRPKQQ